MDDLLLIDWLTRALASAARDADWDKVAQLDGEIAALLGVLQKQPLLEPKRLALSKLQKVHKEVLLLAQRHSQQLELKMAQLHQQRDGAQAYAAFMDEE
ncbi:flagellar protein FliT [Kluyvera sichuanensis]